MQEIYRFLLFAIHRTISWVDFQSEVMWSSPILPAPFLGGGALCRCFVWGMRDGDEFSVKCCDYICRGLLLSFIFYLILIFV